MLQEYVHRRIQQFNFQPLLQQQLGAEAAAALQQATRQLLAAAKVECGDGIEGAERQLALVFRHDCR